MASAPPTQAVPPSERIAWHRIFRLTAELSALFSFVAFALSCVMNSLVFARWRHDFLQLATPSDVVMSGTHLLGDIAGPLFVAGVAALLALGSIMGSDTLGAMARKLPGGSRIAAYIGTPMTIAFLAGWASAFLYAFYGLVTGDHFLSDTVDLGLGTFLLLALAVMVWELARDGHTGLDPGCATYAYWTYALASLPAGLLLCAGWFDTRIERLAAYGFHEQHLAVLESGTDVCGGGSRLLWSGTQAELIKCPGGTAQTGRIIVVKRNSENLTIQPATPAVR